LKNKDVVKNLLNLGLSQEQAGVYAFLLEESSSAKSVMQGLSMSKTTLYRTLSELEVLGCVSKSADRYVAKNPDVLSYLVANEEVRLDQMKSSIQQLSSVNRAATKSEIKFETFEGIAGLKQMLWFELTQRGVECLVFSNIDLDSIFGADWANKFRTLLGENGITSRGLINPECITKDLNLIKENYLKKTHNRKVINKAVFDIFAEIIVFPDFVHIYGWASGKEQLYTGLRVTSKEFATMFKANFEALWLRAVDKTAFDEEN
jgi:predicted transcriptional regulator